MEDAVKRGALYHFYDNVYTCMFRNFIFVIKSHRLICFLRYK